MVTKKVNRLLLSIIVLVVTFISIKPISYAARNCGKQLGNCKDTIERSGEKRFQFCFPLAPGRSYKIKWSMMRVGIYKTIKSRVEGPVGHFGKRAQRSCFFFNISSAPIERGQAYCISVVAEYQTPGSDMIGQQSYCEYQLRW